MPTDYLLEIDGIPGESADDKHANTIEVLSFSWGMSQTGSFSSGAGGGAGKVNFQDMTFTSMANKASPKLMNACATGAHIKKATLFVRKSGGEREDYYVILIEDLLVSSVSDSGGTDIPIETYTINFAKIKYEYKPQKADGTLDTGVVFTYDLKKGVK